MVTNTEAIVAKLEALEKLLVSTADLTSVRQVQLKLDIVSRWLSAELEDALARAELLDAQAELLDAQSAIITEMSSRLGLDLEPASETKRRPALRVVGEDG